MREFDKVILGEECIYSTDCEETQLNNNIIVCGGTGSGKTMSVSEPRLLQTYNSSLVVTVTKKRLVEKYREEFKRRGYEVEELNFVHPEQGNVVFDPIDYVKTPTDVAFLARSIILANPKSQGGDKDPYWDEAGISLLSAEIACAISYARRSAKPVSFEMVLRLHDNLRLNNNGRADNVADTSLDKVMRELGNDEFGVYAKGCWRTISGIAMRTASCIFSTVNAAIDKLFSSEMRKLFISGKKLDIEAIGGVKTILFITTSPVNAAMNNFVSLLYAQLFKQLFEYAERLDTGVLPVPVHMLCDDFATGSPINNFAAYISIFREKGISVTLLLQSESQLQGLYGSRDAATIINNADTYVYLGGNDLSTAQVISLRMNMPLEEVLYMPVGQEFLFRRGQRPIITRRYNIKEDREYQRITSEYKKRLAGCER